MPDNLTVALDEIRERANRRLTFPVTSSTALQGAIESAGDVPRLLAALDEVLKLHQPVGRGRVMNCCEGCEAVNGEFHEDCCHEWPCPTVQAISRALLGEEGGDG